MTHMADPMMTPLERSTAQKLRVDRELSYQSEAARAHYWAARQRDVAKEDALVLEQSVAAISQGSVRQQTQFASANISSATLQSASPTLPEEAGVAGVGPNGVIPPPPPA